jgi:hypothetical protein
MMFTLSSLPKTIEDQSFALLPNELPWAVLLSQSSALAALSTIFPRGRGEQKSKSIARRTTAPDGPARGKPKLT